MLVAAPGSLGRDNAEFTWSGTWSSNWGTMTLTQTGSTVDGTYTHDQGHINGKVSGNVMTGRWDEAPTRKGPNDAGAVILRMEADGRSLKGDWNYDGNQTWRKNGWTGSCTSGPCTENGKEDKWPPLPNALVPIASVSNGCGGGEANAQGKFGDTSTYKDSNINPAAQSYTVNFREACKLHDAGYSGAKVTDALHGGKVVDFFTSTRAQVDTKFLEDMRLICDSTIPATATTARANCRATGGNVSVGALSRYNFVNRAGGLFWKERPKLRGQWTLQGSDGPPWAIVQSVRTVKAVWRGGTGHPNLRGEFRGTLISRDQDSIVRGSARVTENGKTTRGAMSFRYDPDKEDQLTVSGPGVSGTLTR